MKKYFSLLLLSFLIFPSSGCAPKKKKPKAPTEARVNVPNWGVVIDANYDEQLDGLVPGYKMITVALTNHSVDVIKLDQIHDRWTIEDAWGKKQQAIISLRLRDPKAWGELPPKVKDLVEYPAGVQMGYSQTFDVFFPAHLDLHKFRTISFYSSTLKQNFDAISSASLDKATKATPEETMEVIQKKPPTLFDPIKQNKGDRSNPTYR